MDANRYLEKVTNEADVWNGHKAEREDERSELSVADSASLWCWWCWDVGISKPPRITYRSPLHDKNSL